jgi:hypothetical protein
MRCVWTGSFDGKITPESMSGTSSIAAVVAALAAVSMQFHLLVIRST